MVILAMNDKVLPAFSLLTMFSTDGVWSAVTELWLIQKFCLFQEKKKEKK